MSPEAIYNSLSIADRNQIASKCFRDGLFDAEGEIACADEGRWGGHNCRLEFLCEMMAAVILVPTYDHGLRALPDSSVAQAFGVEEWVVRFRSIISENQGALK